MNSYIFLASLASCVNWREIKRKKAIERELLFLKNQFHSPLTFDFLNFCYDRVIHISPETASSIKGFSNVLNYSMSQSFDKLIPLKWEIKCIEDCISFHKCLTTDLCIQFSYLIEEDIHVPPKLLLIFIENSLKHGVLQDSLYPIKIRIEANKAGIVFTIDNKKNNQKSFFKSGMGLKNSKRILELFYPEKYSLVIESDTDFFHCKLRLKN